ncbi:hypothetical protein [Mesorhizobium sp. KR9-304]|uniref:hypothetical protein n=1 Tax=Mesorhizobium sp. KR9-304 TaxID=3156614 RepID=UPI0032B4CA8F
MKTALIAALLFTASPAFASPEDDYVACLIGRAAVALLKQNPPMTNAEAAQEVAYGFCPEPASIGADPNGEAVEGISDYVNLMVERMAAE